MFNYDSFLQKIEKHTGSFSIFEKELSTFLSTYLDTKFLSYTGQSGDKGIDAIYYVAGANKITFFQFKLGKPSNKMSVEDIDNIVYKITKFISSTEIHYKQDSLNEAAYQIKDSGKIQEIEIIVLTTYTFTKDVPRDVNTDTIPVNGNNIPIFKRYYDKKTFFDCLHRLKIEKSFNESVKGKQMEFDLEPGNFIEHSHKEGYTLKVSAEDLLKKSLAIIKNPERHDMLTHKNVRDFLGEAPTAKDTIAKGIKYTLTNEGENLYAYHMGLVVLCEGLQISENKDKLTVSSPSFVNGAQTLGTLLSLKQNEREQIKADAHFTIRFIKAGDTTKASRDFAEKIVIATNSSRPITEQMQYAFDPNQAKIARIFEERGIRYDYRAAESSVAQRINDEVLRVHKLIGFDNDHKLKPFYATNAKAKKVTPDQLAQALYAVQTHEYWTVRSNKSIFRYSSVQNSVYNQTFYTSNDNYQTRTLRTFEEYFLPLAVKEIFDNRLKFYFDMPHFTIEPKAKTISLPKNEAKKIAWVLFVEFLKSNDMNTLDTFVAKFHNEDKPFEYYQTKINEFLDKTNKEFINGKGKPSSLKKALLKETNLADFARSPKQW